MDNTTVSDGGAADGSKLRLLQGGHGGLTRRQLEARNQQRRADLLAYTEQWWDAADELHARIWELRRLPKMAGQAPRSYQASRTPSPLSHRVAAELGCGVAEADRILASFRLDPKERWAVYLEERPDVTTLGPFHVFARHLKLSEDSPYSVPAIPYLEADPTWPDPPPSMFTFTHGPPHNSNSTAQGANHFNLDRFKRNQIKKPALLSAERASSKADGSTTEPTKAPSSTNEASTQNTQRHEINAWQRANPAYWSDAQTWAAISEIRAEPSHGQRLDSRIAIRLNLQCFRAWNLCKRFDVDRAETEQVMPTVTLCTSADCVTPLNCIQAQRCKHPSYETGEAVEGCLRVIGAHPGRF